MQVLSFPPRGGGLGRGAGVWGSIFRKRWTPTPTPSPQGGGEQTKLEETPMDLRFTPEENAFREEVRTFFKENLPDGIRRKAAEGIRYVKDDIVTWQRILNKKGWAVPHWPKEWGGTGWSPVQLYIFRDEMQQAPAPEPLAFGVNMVGPVIIAFGNEAQKRKYLPRIANLDD